MNKKSAYFPKANSLKEKKDFRFRGCQTFFQNVLLWISLFLMDFLQIGLS